MSMSARNDQPHNQPHDQPEEETTERLNGLLRQVILLRETGPKSAAWHRARKQAMWRLHALIDSRQQQDTPNTPTTRGESSR